MESLSSHDIFISVKNKIDSNSEKKLQHLLERSFQKKIKEEHSFDIYDSFYIEKSFKSAALFIHTPLGNYLSKLAIAPEIRGTGMLQTLWNLCRKDYTSLFWRCKKNNFLAGWYKKMAEEFHETPTWLIFAYGIQESKVSISKIIEFCDTKEEDFL